MPYFMRCYIKITTKWHSKNKCFLIYILVSEVRILRNVWTLNEFWIKANNLSNIHTVILIILYKWLQTRHFQIRYQFSVPPFANWIQLIDNCKAKIVRSPIQVQRENSSYQNAPGKGSIHYLNEQRTKVHLGCPILDNFEPMWIYGSSGEHLEMIEVVVICPILLLLLFSGFNPVME